MGFVQINDLSIAFRREDVVGLEVSAGGGESWTLRVYLRGCGEPLKIPGDQLHLGRIYKYLLDSYDGNESINIR